MLSLTYSDKVKGESDEVEIELEDVDDLWKNAWYPEKGAKLTVTIGTLKCGTFEIDEIEIKGPPDTVTIRGMATGITNTLRTKKSDANENKTLKQIAQKIADRNGLEMFEITMGSIPSLTLSRSTQNKETDLGYLKRISQDHGVVFAVRDKKMVFDSVYNLENRKESFILDKTDIESYSLQDKSDGMVKSAKVESKNAKKNESVSTNLEFENYKKENPGYTAPPVVSQDAYVSSSRSENTQQAESKAKAIMHTSASNQQKGSISIQFNPLAIAGNNFKITQVLVIM
jgi:phage protein D